MKHVLLGLVLIAAASDCGAQSVFFGGRGFAGGARYDRSPLIFRTPGGIGRFPTSGFVNLGTRSGARAIAPYNYQSGRFRSRDMYLVPNGYWGWQLPVRQRQSEPEIDLNLDDDRPARPETGKTGWRKYLRDQ